MVYQNQHIDIEIPNCSRDHVIVSDVVKVTFNFDIESTGKTLSVVNNLGRALVKKRVLMLGSKQIDAIHMSDLSDTYNNLYLYEKEREENLPQYIWILTFQSILYILKDLKKIYG